MDRRTEIRLFTKLFSACKLAQGQRCRGLYKVTYNRNSLKRALTVTPENQFKRLEESATPLAHRPYNDQLESKRHVLERALKKVVNVMRHNKGMTFTPDMERHFEENHGLICPLVDLKPAPKTEGFRNKEDLNILTGIDGDPNTIGLSVGRGIHSICVSCDSLINGKPLHKRIVKSFRSFLETSEFRKRERGSGYRGPYWNKLLIRSNEKGQVMLAPELRCHEITQELVNDAKKELLDFTLSQTQEPIDSLHLRVGYKGYKTLKLESHVHGDTHIYETVLGSRFRISPAAFFQLNTPAAEVLYSQVMDMAHHCRPHTLLDIGCGTGTIGILLSPLVERVIGFDVVEEAVEDARFNAQLNGIHNASYHGGSARRTMKGYAEEKEALTENTLAVVNPNRNGLNWKAIQRIRSCDAIRHVIFISCKPYGNPLINFADLIAPESEDHPSTPFKAVKAVGVDMFPHTIHTELVILFQR